MRNYLANKTMAALLKPGVQTARFAAQKRAAAPSLTRRLPSNLKVASVQAPTSQDLFARKEVNPASINFKSRGYCARSPHGQLQNTRGLFCAGWQLRPERPTAIHSCGYQECNSRKVLGEGHVPVHGPLGSGCAYRCWPGRGCVHHQPVVGAADCNETMYILVPAVPKGNQLAGRKPLLQRLGFSPQKWPIPMQQALMA